MPLASAASLAASLSLHPPALAGRIDGRAPLAAVGVEVVDETGSGLRTPAPLDPCFLLLAASSSRSICFRIFSASAALSAARSAALAFVARSRASASSLFFASCSAAAASSAAYRASSSAIVSEASKEIRETYRHGICLPPPAFAFAAPPPSPSFASRPPSLPKAVA